MEPIDLSAYGPLGVLAASILAIGGLIVWGVLKLYKEVIKPHSESSQKLAEEHTRTAVALTQASAANQAAAEASAKATANARDAAIVTKEVAESLRETTEQIHEKGHEFIRDLKQTLETQR